VTRCEAGTKLFVARKFGVAVQESGTVGRSVRDYVRLPAERYNVLDTKAVQRLDDDTFRVSTGPQRFLGIGEAEPVGFIQIRVLADGVEQRLSRAELVPVKPSGVLDEINATLTNIRLLNTVTSEAAPGGGRLLVCQLVLNGSFTRGVLARVPEDRLNSLMAWALGVAMPWFLSKLAEDYASWAADRPRNASLGAGEMAALARSVASGGGKLPAGVVELSVDAAHAAAAIAPAAPTAEESAAEGPAKTARGTGFGR